MTFFPSIMPLPINARFFLVSTKDGNIYLHINNVRVSLGNTVSAEKIAQIPPIMEKLGRKKGILHMENYSDSRETITFEKKKASKEKEKDAEKEN